MFTEPRLVYEEPVLYKRAVGVKDEPVLTIEPGVLRMSRCLQTSRGIKDEPVLTNGTGGL